MIGPRDLIERTAEVIHNSNKAYAERNHDQEEEQSELLPHNEIEFDEEGLS